MTKESLSDESVLESSKIVQVSKTSNETSLKRKSSVAGLAEVPTTAQIESIHLPGESDDNLEYDQDCNQIRRKIRSLIDSGEVKVTHWLRELGVNSNSYGRFMKLKGPTSGVDNQTFHAAYKYFKKREIAKVPAPSKKRKSTDGKTVSPTATIPDVHDFILPGEEQDDVEVYDTGDEIRRKIAAHLRKDGITAAGFLRELASLYHTQDRTFQNSQLTKFRGYKSADQGNQNGIFYTAYVYFEKIRLKEGKPKSKHRLAMEDKWPGGF